MACGVSIQAEGASDRNASVPAGWEDEAEASVGGPRWGVAGDRVPEVKMSRPHRAWWAS